MNGLVITFLIGLFFVVGIIIAWFNKENKNIVNFSISMSFIVLIILIIFHIFPEAIHHLEDVSFIFLIIGILIGIGMLMLIDKLIPHHTPNGHNHLKHLGILTSISLIIHNIIEGICVYSVVDNNLGMGLSYAFAVGLHNIPFGIKLGLILSINKKSYGIWIINILLIISTFIGGLLMHSVANYITDFSLGLILAITIGMILYLIIFELYPSLKKGFNKYSLFGIIIGIIIMLVGLVI